MTPPLLNTATAVKAGAASAVKVYAGNVLVWPTIASFQEAVVATTPEFFLRMAETSGAAAADVMGRWPGTYFGTLDYSRPSLVPSDPAAKSVKFNASGEYMRVTTGGNLAVGFAVMIAYRATTSSPYPLWRDNTSAGGTGSYVSISGSFVAAGVAGTALVTSYLKSQLEDGKEHLILLTRDAQNVVSLYIDDPHVPLITQVKTGTINSGTIYFARNGTNSVTQVRPGEFAEATFWNRGLMPSEIIGIFTGWNASA